MGAQFWQGNKIVVGCWLNVPVKKINRIFEKRSTLFFQFACWL